MSVYLRVQNGVAVESWTSPAGKEPADCFPAELAETFYLAGKAKVGWGWDGSSFSKPTPTDTTLQITTLSRSDVYRRCTDAEVAQIDEAFSKQPLRMQRIFESAQILRSDDEVWPILHDAAVDLFGVDRAAALLEQSS